MPPLTFWNGVGAKNKDYKFFDRMASQYINMGATEFYAHKLVGPLNPDPKLATPDADVSDLLTISDLVNLEVRDRKYDRDVYSLKGHYMVTDTEFDLKQFGFFLSTDTVFITFHINQMVTQLGRRLMSGDVLEVLHMRDDTTLDGQAINKFYVIQEGTRPAEGFSPTWWPHLWRVKCQPLTDSQEFQDILNRELEDRGDGIVPEPNPDGSMPTLGSLTSVYDKEISINDGVLEEATANVAFRNWQSAHFYILEDDLDKSISVYNSDGIPPNSSKPVPSGTSFPAVVKEGDYFLRMDYLPPILFQRQGPKWKRIESNYRAPWLPANRVLTTFINNKARTTLADGVEIDERQNLRTAIAPKLDPDII